MAKKFTLGEKERLKSRKRIDQVFKEGSKFNLTPFRIYYFSCLREGDSGKGLKAGFGVSVKTFKKAVDRNRIKRMTREAWRLQKNELQQLIHPERELDVFIVYTGNEIISYSVIAEKIKKIISKLSVTINEKN